jgi:hypothetical protein
LHTRRGSSTPVTARQGLEWRHAEESAKAGDDIAQVHQKFTCVVDC